MEQRAVHYLFSPTVCIFSLSTIHARLPLIDFNVLDSLFPAGRDSRKWISSDFVRIHCVFFVKKQSVLFSITDPGGFLNTKGTLARIDVSLPAPQIACIDDNSHQKAARSPPRPKPALPSFISYPSSHPRNRRKKASEDYYQTTEPSRFSRTLLYRSHGNAERALIAR